MRRAIIGVAAAAIAAGAALPAHALGVRGAPSTPASPRAHSEHGQGQRPLGASSRGPLLPASLLPAALGPTPVGTDGGKPVLVSPTWQMTRNGPFVPWPSAWPRPVRFLPTGSGPLRGLVIALDPGHNIGNGSHVGQINRPYWVGFTKICNTTGTATNSGYPEATYTFDVAARLRALLTAAGATVVVTRDRNSVATYGPCIGARGAFGKQENAAFMVQIHADGGPGSGHGFHTIVPANGLGNTALTWKQDRVLATAMIAGMKSAGFTPATYLSSTMQVRHDQGAMTVSKVPIVTVETLNMRNAGDAGIATSAAGRQRVAEGLYRGILAYAAHLPR